MRSRRRRGPHGAWESWTELGHSPGTAWTQPRATAWPSGDFAEISRTFECYVWAKEGNLEAGTG